MPGAQSALASPGTVVSLDREVVKRAIAGCDGVLVVPVLLGMNHYASGTAQAVLDYATPDARCLKAT